MYKLIALNIVTNILLYTYAGVYFVCFYFTSILFIHPFSLTISEENPWISVYFIALFVDKSMQTDAKHWNKY